MKMMTTLKDSHVYELRYYEESQRISVTKDGRLKYWMVPGRRYGGRLWICNCPQSVFRNDYCKHMAMAQNLIRMPTIKEPWADAAERYIMEMDQHLPNANDTIEKYRKTQRARSAPVCRS